MSVLESSEVTEMYGVLDTSDVLDTSAVALVPDGTSAVVDMEMNDVSTSFNTSLNKSGEGSLALSGVFVSDFNFITWFCFRETS